MHCNNLTKVQEELVGLLQEEAAEVIQELSKIRRTGTEFGRKGSNTPNIQFLFRELTDLRLLLEIATRAGLFDGAVPEPLYEASKKERLKLWTNLPHGLIESI